ncbi:DUF998 domain-containing protein [Pollutibacter soli]|uniref:DUF998 domain-containing protein n=1 Tax=Pollutibacter soli TaxID=3034157 RepID=UPI003013B927
MLSPANIQGGHESASEIKQSQSRWWRLLLLIILGYEGAGALAGGFLLVAAPDGRWMKMPVEIMHGSFPDFLIPGIILVVLGILNTVAFFAVYRRSRFDWVLSVMAMGGLLTWFWIEIAILLELHWLHAMWGLPVVVGFIAAFRFVPAMYRMYAMLSCGLLSSLLYFVINIIVPSQWEGYSLVSNVPSELSAIGAPTRTLWNILVAPYTLLIIGFAWGVLKVAGENGGLRITGKLFLIYGLLGILWPFAPMHMRETLVDGGGTISDTLHIALGAVTNIIYLLALAFAGNALGKKFKIFSVTVFFLVLIFGILTFRDSPGIGRNGPTPLIGIWERIDIGLFLIWISTLSAILLLKEANNSRVHAGLTEVKSVPLQF